MSNAAHSKPNAPDAHNTATDGNAAPTTPDAIDAVAHAAPIILPIVGGVLMFLLAFIAVFMA